MNTSLDPSSTEAAERIRHAEEVAKFLRHNVVQGQKISQQADDQTYRENLQPQVHSHELTGCLQTSGYIVRQKEATTTPSKEQALQN